MDAKTPPTTIDPLRRVFIPIEKKMESSGNFRFRTTDRTRYSRDGKSGTIYRLDAKPASKKERRKLRRQGGSNAVSN